MGGGGLGDRLLGGLRDEWGVGRDFWGEMGVLFMWL